MLYLNRRYVPPILADRKSYGWIQKRSNFGIMVTGAIKLLNTNKLTKES